MNFRKKSIILLCSTVAFLSAEALGQTCTCTCAALINPRDGDFCSKATGNWRVNGTWCTYNAKTGTWGDAATTPIYTSLALVCSPHSVEVTTTGSPNDIGTLIIEDANAPTSPGEVKIHSSSGSLFQWLGVYAALDMKAAKTDPGRILLTDNGTVGSPPKLLAGTDIVIGGLVRSAAAVRVGAAIETTGSYVATIAPKGVVAATNAPLVLNGAFEMEGTVLADGPYTITVQGSGPRAGSSGKWEIAHDSGTIKFATTTDPLTINSSAGCFLIKGGTLDIDQTLTFRGGLKQLKGTVTNGKIDVAAGKTFTVTGRYLGP